MATNIEMNYFDGNEYIVLYPKADFSNMNGSLTASQIPNLSASKITSGTFDSSRLPSSINATTLNGYSYSSIISAASAGINGYRSAVRGVSTASNVYKITVNWSGFTGYTIFCCRGSYFGGTMKPNTTFATFPQGQNSYTVYTVSCTWSTYSFTTEGSNVIFNPSSDTNVLVIGS